MDGTMGGMRLTHMGIEPNMPKLMGMMGAELNVLRQMGTDTSSLMAGMMSNMMDLGMAMQMGMDPNMMQLFGKMGGVADPC
eukprot:10302890-Alexandrium_andersonii.AAC.1